MKSTHTDIFSMKKILFLFVFSSVLCELIFAVFASSLLILDNIQCIPQISTLLTSIALDFPQYHISSIYKGVVNSDSFSVHDFDILTLYPLDFEEFLWANAEFALTREIRNHFSDFSPMGKKLHEKALSQFRLYLIIGGMPAAIMEYKKEKKLLLVPDT